MPFSTRKAALAAAAAFGLLALAACGGGGGGAPAKTAMEPAPGGGGMMEPEEPAPKPTGPTPAIAVKIGDLELASIHLEVTDNYTVGDGIASGDDLVDQELLFSRSRRYDAVCPGLPPAGNECKSTRTQLDGTWYDNLEGEYFDYTEQVFLQMRKLDLAIRNADSPDDILRKGSDPRPSEDGGIGAVERLWAFKDFTPSQVSWGGYGDHMAYYTTFTYAFGGSKGPYLTWSAAFGELHPDYPTAEQGGGTWVGEMTGAVRSNGFRVGGGSVLTYDFDSDEVDLTLNSIAALPDLEQEGQYAGPTSIEWTGLKANDDGSFYLVGYGNHKPNTDLHPTLGYVDGDFYGPNAEEMAGVFEKPFGEDALVGAFGGIRQPDE